MMFYMSHFFYERPVTWTGLEFQNSSFSGGGTVVYFVSKKTRILNQLKRACCLHFLYLWSFLSFGTVFLSRKTVRGLPGFLAFSSGTWMMYMKFGYDGCACKIKAVVTHCEIHTSWKEQTRAHLHAHTYTQKDNSNAYLEIIKARCFSKSALFKNTVV